MAKTEYQINLDYQQALQYASRLEEIADSMNKDVVSSFKESLVMIHDAWDGENASAYVKKCEQLNTKIEHTVNKLREAAAAVRKIAKLTYDAEMHALEIARVRKY